MSDDATRLEVLAKTATEMEASMIVGALEAAGIRARAVGGYTASFRAEAPGEMRVLVRSEDLPRAKEVLRQWRQNESPVDWSQIDVGDEE